MFARTLALAVLVACLTCAKAAAGALAFSADAGTSGDIAGLAERCYGCPAAPGHFDVEPWRKGQPGEYEVRWQSLIRTGYDRNDEAKAILFLPHVAGKRPAVVVLHSWRTRYAGSEKRLCRALARSGLAAMLVQLPFHLGRAPAGTESGDLMLTGDLSRTMLAWRQAVVDARTALRFLASRPEVDQSRIGIAGVSLGAVLAAVCLGVEPDFRCGVLILGGGNLARALTESPVLRVVLRPLRKAITALPIEDWSRPLDPVTYGPAARDRPVLMINGYHDIIVPPPCAQALWQALGRPEIRWLPTGHYGPGLVRGQINDLCARFFSVAFGEAAGPLPRVCAPGIKVGLLLDSTGPLRPTIGLELARVGRRAWLDFSVRTNGLSLDLVRSIRAPLVAGLSLRRDGSRARLIPVVGLQVTL